MNQQSPYPGQQPQQPIEPQQQPVAPQQPGISGMAVAALVLGVVGVTTSFVPIVNNAAFFLGIIGLVLAIVGLVGINKGKKRGRGIAVAGQVLGIVTTPGPTTPTRRRPSPWPSWPSASRTACSAKPPS